MCLSSRDRTLCVFQITICRENNQKLEKVLIIDYSENLESLLQIAGKKFGKQKPKGLYFANNMQKIHNLQTINQGDKLILK